MEPVAKGRLASLAVRNYRLYFGGQLLSQPGTYIQTIGQAWLVLKLTHSGADLGLVTAAQYLPVLIFGAWGGVIADRFDNRKIMCVTQSAAGIFALALAGVVLGHVVQLWMVMVLAAGLGAVLVADSPARQSFASELVGPAQVQNAVALNLTLNNVARVVGPSIGALLIAFVGIGYCFLLNGLSYGAVVLALVVIDKSKLFPRPRAPRTRDDLRLGMRHIRERTILRDVLIMLGVTGFTMSSMAVDLPLIASRTFHGNATTFAYLTTAAGIGAVIGGVISARARVPGIGILTRLAVVWLVLLVAAAIAPTFVVELIAIGVLGLMTTSFTINANAMLQQNSDPELRGRVMAYWAVALLGTQPIGGPIFGVVADHLGARWGLGSSAVGVVAIVAIGLHSLRVSAATKEETALQSVTYATTTP
jgi:MFS family permease